MFTAYGALGRKAQELRAAGDQERRLQRVSPALQDRFGKNAVLKGMNFVRGGTAIEHSGRIGGHKTSDR